MVGEDINLVQMHLAVSRLNSGKLEINWIWKHEGRARGHDAVFIDGTAVKGLTSGIHFFILRGP